MAKKVAGYLKLAGAGRVGQPVAADRAGARPARHQHHGVLQGVQRPDRRTWRRARPIPVVITYYQDKSFTFEMKTPPVSFFLKKAASVPKGSQAPGPRPGRQRHQGAGARHRPEEDEGPQRRRRRSGDAHGRGLGPLDGPPGGGVGRWQTSESASRPPARASTARSSIRSTRR